jgi:hypothetical protein
MTKTMANDFERDNKQIQCALVHPGEFFLHAFRAILPSTPGDD